MFGHKTLGVKAHEVSNHGRRQQLVQDDQVAAREQVNGPPRQATRPLPGYLFEVMPQPCAPLANARGVLDVVLGYVALHQTHVVTMHAVGHEVEHGFFIGAEVIAQSGVEWVG